MRASTREQRLWQFLEARAACAAAPADALDGVEATGPLGMLSNELLLVVVERLVHLDPRQMHVGREMRQKVRNTVSDAMALLGTCRWVRRVVMACQSDLYNEVMARRATRFVPIDATALRPHTTQLMAEERSRQHLWAFAQAMSELVLHCATEHCDAAREELNNKLKLAHEWAAEHATPMVKEETDRFMRLARDGRDLRIRRLCMPRTRAIAIAATRRCAVVYSRQDRTVHRIDPESSSGAFIPQKDMRHSQVLAHDRDACTLMDPCTFTGRSRGNIAMSAHGEFVALVIHERVQAPRSLSISIMQTKDDGLTYAPFQMITDTEARNYDNSDLWFFEDDAGTTYLGRLLVRWSAICLVRYYELYVLKNNRFEKSREFYLCTGENATRMKQFHAVSASGSVVVFVEPNLNGPNPVQRIMLLESLTGSVTHVGDYEMVDVTKGIVCLCVSPCASIVVVFTEFASRHHGQDPEMFSPTMLVYRLERRPLTYELVRQMPIDIRYPGVQWWDSTTRCAISPCGRFVLLMLNVGENNAGLLSFDLSVHLEPVPTLVGGGKNAMKRMVTLFRLNRYHSIAWDSSGVWLASDTGVLLVGT